MATYFLAVHTRPIPGMEDEFHRWYDEFHLDEVLTVPDFVAAERFVLVEGETNRSLDDRSHLAVFTITSDEIGATMAAFRDAQKSMRQPACLDGDSVALSWWRQITGRHPQPSPAAK